MNKTTGWSNANYVIGCVVSYYRQTYFKGLKRANLMWKKLRRLSMSQAYCDSC